jgi:FAD/FMN-containing dehydrogenase
MKELSDEAIDTMLEHFKKAPSPNSAVAIEQVGGAVSRVPKDATAFDHRDMPYNFLIAGMWPNASDNDKGIRWVKAFWEAMQPFSAGGVYVNYLGQEADEGAERLKAAYGAKKYKRLVALKNQYDPKNLFRINQNIKPSV